MAFRSARSRIAIRRYLVSAALLLLTVGASGWLLNAWMTAPVEILPASEKAPETVKDEFDAAFRRAVSLMQAGEYEQALSAWHRALLLDAGIVEVKVNMGFTLFELGRYVQARDFFIAALEQNAYQANAYYGLAIVSEKMGDLEGALGAMRSFIHLAGSGQDERFIRRARAALWEWETQLAGAVGNGEAGLPAETPPEQ